MLLDGALQQIEETQLSVNKTMQLLASVRATVGGYVQTKAEMDKSMGDMEQAMDKSREKMENMKSDMATHQVVMKSLMLCQMIR